MAIFRSGCPCSVPRQDLDSQITVLVLVVCSSVVETFCTSVCVCVRDDSFVSFRTRHVLLGLSVPCICCKPLALKSHHFSSIQPSSPHLSSSSNLNFVCKQKASTMRRVGEN
eukprot:scpid63112/ scgid21291/ 